ncbi:MAG: hypothetical protein U0Z70_12305 [Thermomicrobiales bacterium]
MPAQAAGQAASPMQVVLELGKKGKRVVAVAPAWPGLSRGDKTEEAALERLHTYLPRYAPVARLAGLEAEFAASQSLHVVERFPGTGSTDFWGISFACSEFDRQVMTEADLERELSLLQACWDFFDAARARVSAELRKGPRGGGWDRDHLVWHTVATELDWGKKLGLPGVTEAMPDDAYLREHRDAYLAAIRAYHAAGKPARTWPLRFLIRHSAFHTMDHAWQMEDRDLTGQNA